MSIADIKYKELISDIIQNGEWDNDKQVRAIWLDGKPAYTKSVISKKLQFDNTEVPILTTKQVYWKTAIKELLWIWQIKSNRVQDLRNMNFHIWNEWEIQEGEWKGTIGAAYGYQLGKPCRAIPSQTIEQDKYNVGIDYPKIDQVDYLLWSLKNNPSSRRHLTTLWDKDDLDEMSLTPCVWKTNWIIKRGKMHLVVGIRSNDLALGNPFNVFQYYVLQRMIAQVTGYELGTLTFDIDDCHLYDRHQEALIEQIKRDPYPAPTLWIKPEIKNFYDFTIDDFKLIDYKYHPSIKMEVAI
ncbi:thymidylate synthase 1 [Brevibacillus reuszeri]|uniref:Thymidylate synthase n=1 Tax=Brevibacillus reuszeri TaxID=54915 RepID=A0A0K9YNC2_9BACL|nr:thymidylate synthase [Brevibacillus reuszeri]KNB70214.1 thymidylate synthase [Brevibacillus reuszeri]MED1859170.1 thymidylate synthase [Brevibacillus reuszeri]GED72340.1 thymidylate synthase 1 [Brevibacillus reuszeri]